MQTFEKVLLPYTLRRRESENIESTDKALLALSTLARRQLREVYRLLKRFFLPARRELEEGVCSLLIRFFFFSLFWEEET